MHMHLGRGHADPAAEAEAGAWPEAQAEIAADAGALTVMAEADAEMNAISRSDFHDDLARAQAGAERFVEQRARDQAERERAAIDELIGHAQASRGRRRGRQG
jgi:hypothetical protein